jgi:hypothetical protein
MNSWGSYPSIFNLGHRAVRDLLNYPHVIEEKVDGSQFSFGLIELEREDPTGWVSEGFQLLVRSKGAIMLADAPEKMFARAVETAKRLRDEGLLHPGWTYRAEYLAKPKHNTLAYDRVPEGNLIVFDVSTGDNEWLDPAAKAEEAHRIGLECVPVLAIDRTGGETTLDTLRRIIDTTQSVLRGQLIEGIVVKPLVDLYGVDKKTLMGKFVSERFKEAHKQAWKVTSPNSGDILDQLIKTYAVEGRWMKAVQHLRDGGQLVDSPKDIGALLVEVQKDLGQEEKEDIQRKLWRWAWPHIQRGVCRGFPEWYKNDLLRKQFETDGGGMEVAISPIDTYSGIISE